MTNVSRKAATFICRDCGKNKKQSDFYEAWKEMFCKDCCDERARIAAEKAAHKKDEYFLTTHGVPSIQWICNACKQKDSMGQVFLTSPNTLSIKVSPHGQEHQVRFQIISGICNDPACGSYNVLLSRNEALQQGYAETSLNGCGTIEYVVDAESSRRYGDSFVESPVPEKYFLTPNQAPAFFKLLTAHEKNLFKMLRRGKSIDAISKEINHEKRAVEQQVESLEKKLGSFRAASSNRG